MMIFLYVVNNNVYNFRGKYDNKYYRKIFKWIINVWGIFEKDFLFVYDKCIKFICL